MCRALFCNETAENVIGELNIQNYISLCRRIWWLLSDRRSLKCESIFVSLITAKMHEITPCLTVMCKNKLSHFTGNGHIDGKIDKNPLNNCLWSTKLRIKSNFIFNSRQIFALFLEVVRIFFVLSFLSIRYSLHCLFSCCYCVECYAMYQCRSCTTGTSLLSNLRKSEAFHQV